MTSTVQSSAFPKLDSPMVSPGGALTLVWQRFMLSMWSKLGGNASQASTAVFLSTSAAPSSGSTSSGSAAIAAYNSSTGALIGTISTTGTGGPAQVISPTASGFTYTAPGEGSLLVLGARVDVSRDGGTTFYPVTLTGGAVPLLTGDVAKLTWFSAQAPTVTWLPNANS